MSTDWSLEQIDFYRKHHPKEPVSKKKLKLLTRTSDRSPAPPPTQDLYEAFGILTWQKYKPELPPVLVMEVDENGVYRNYLVPKRYSGSGRWLLSGRHVYEFLGHTFLEHRPLPSCFLCLGAGLTSKMAMDFFKCRECKLICEEINLKHVQTSCPKEKILKAELQFPYD